MTTSPTAGQPQILGCDVVAVERGPEYRVFRLDGDADPAAVVAKLRAGGMRARYYPDAHAFVAEWGTHRGRYARLGRPQPRAVVPPASPRA